MACKAITFYKYKTEMFSSNYPWIPDVQSHIFYVEERNKKQKKSKYIKASVP